MLNREKKSLQAKHPIKVVQFGEGNFLRAFVDYAFYKLNDKHNLDVGVAVVQPIEKGLVHMLNDQDGLYTLFSRGVMDGKEIQEKFLVDSIVKGIDPYTDFEEYLALGREPQLQFVISNTTESGIAFNADDRPNMSPPNSFPAKLTLLLYERFTHFKGANDKGLTIIPCELINYNADTLKSIIDQYIEIWNLGDDFRKWMNEANSFHNTLVDRIVPGYPKDEIESYEKQLDYKDNLIVTSEVFFLWIIEGDEKLKEKLPFEGTDLDVKIVKDMQPYRTRKVRILNGAHTTMVPMSLMYGNETVKQTVDDNFTGRFVQEAIFEEIIPTLELDKAELEDFAHAVLDRFKNPFIKHYLASIALNSISKFKVRVLPSLLQYKISQGSLPKHLTFAFACLIRFYKGDWKGKELPVTDDETIISEIQKAWGEDSLSQTLELILTNISYWGQDLTQVEGLQESLLTALTVLEEYGVEKGFEEFLN